MPHLKLLTEGIPSLDRRGGGEGVGPSLLHSHCLLGMPAVKEAVLRRWGEEEPTGWR